MNKLYTIFIACFLPFLVFGQKKGKENYNFQNGVDVTLDGNLTEWNLYKSNSPVWSFGITKQGDNLYVAVRIKDEALQMEALNTGIFVNISYDEKKKSGAKLYFPLIDREKRRAMREEDRVEGVNVKQEMLNSVRGYYIEGFSKVIDGLLSLDNHYGIKAVVKLDEKDGLIYESRIPLDLIKFKSDKIAVQIGVNTNFMRLQNTEKVMPRSVNTTIYGRRPAGQKIVNPYAEDTSVWVTGQLK